MSTTERYGTEVWQAIIGLDSDALAKGSSYWFSTAQIAERGGVTKPTARKYLKALIDSGHVAKIGPKHSPLYTLEKGFWK